MLVKICGIQTKEAAEVAIENGADFIGFVFARSKRKIDPSQAAEIATTIPKSVRKVGVFVNESIDKMVEIAEQVGLDFIQLHGDESPVVAEKIPYKIIKAFAVDRDCLDTIQSFPCEFYLLDSPKGKYRGGNGKTFDWELISHLDLDSNKIILAGGLNTDNVQQAINLAHPAGVDVSSGVETNGAKDHRKISNFIKKAKRKDESIDNIHHA